MSGKVYPGYAPPRLARKAVYGQAPMRVLIIEDGNEYLDNLCRFVEGPAYVQAHTGTEALALLTRQAIDIIYLDMRFDRIPEGALFGDRQAAARRHNGDAERGLRYLVNHQGLFILDALRRAGHAQPVILAYDFTNEAARFDRLNRQHDNLSWVPDAVSAAEIRARLQRLAGPRPSR